MPDNELIVAEPSGQYARRPPMVVDCSALAAVLFDEPQREAAILALAGKSLHAPDLIGHELASVALKKSRAGLEDLASEGLADFERLEISLYRVAPADQLSIAFDHELSADDAAYLCLAIELGSPLATFDKVLGAAATRVLDARDH